MSDQQDHWRAAMEHNKQVLASQETEMKEYLRRQQQVAEKHIKQFSPALPRKNGVAHQNGNLLMSLFFILKKIVNFYFFRTCKWSIRNHVHAWYTNGCSKKW